MTLIKFYQEWPDFPKDFQPFALEEDIKNFFENFKKAYDKDYLRDGGPHEFVHVRAFFEDHEQTLKALGLFIGTHQGAAYRDWLKKIIGREILIFFTAAIFKLKWNRFEGQQARLLEITQAHKIAVMAPTLPDVSKHIYCHIGDYNKEERKIIYTELKAMKKRVKENDYPFQAWYDEYRLYKELRKEFSWWPW